MFMMMSGISGPPFLRITGGSASGPGIEDGLSDRSWVATSHFSVVDIPGPGDGLVCTVAGAGT